LYAIVAASSSDRQVAALQLLLSDEAGVQKAGETKSKIAKGKVK